jgi:hypothetical protein
MPLVGFAFRPPVKVLLHLLSLAFVLKNSFLSEDFRLF